MDNNTKTTVPLFAQRMARAPEINQMLKRVAKAKGMKSGCLAEQILLAALTKEITKLNSDK